MKNWSRIEYQKAISTLNQNYCVGQYNLDSLFYSFQDLRILWYNKLLQRKNAKI